MLWVLCMILLISMQKLEANYTHILHSVETQKRIPEKLLAAIACVESGYRQKNHHEVRPWTINVHGKGYSFKTKVEAVQAVRNFQKRGYDSIDIGLMQINLKHHPRAFKSLEDAFDPVHNISYAANFLYNLYLKHGSWHRAVRHYHSGNAELNHSYLQKVLKAWAHIKTMGGLIHGAEKLRSSPLDFSRVPPRNGSIQTNLLTQQNKTIPITVTFFPLKMVDDHRKKETGTHPKRNSGAVSGEAHVFPIEFKRKAHRPEKTTQTVRTIPLTISSADVIPLR